MLCCKLKSFYIVLFSTFKIGGNLKQQTILKTILLSPHIYLFSSSNIVANNPFRARYHRWQNSWQTQLYQRMRGFSFALAPRKENLKGFICIIDLFIPQSIVGCPNEFGHLAHITSCAAQLGVGPRWSCYCLCNYLSQVT